MRVELHVVGWRDFRPWHARSGDTRGSLAWSRREVLDDQVVGQVFVRWGMQWLLWGLERLGHELEHVLDESFTNEGHAQHRGHGCLRAYSFWRSWQHAEKATPGQAMLLRSKYWLEVRP